MTRKNLFYLSLLTLFGFSIIGLLIIYYIQGIEIVDFFSKGESISKQLMIGLSTGLVTALLAILIIRLPSFQKSRLFFKNLFSRINPGFHHILFYSFCAGVGEEIFFRGAVQPFLGIWITSIIFVLLHGYISFKNLPLTLYGIFLILVSSSFGYLFDIYGIFACIAAHFLFDVILFLYIRK